MNTILRGLFAACLVVLSAGGRARATDPPPAAAGHVLLLDNERFLEGDITREGERYRIRRALGETWVPAAKVMRLCASREDAYHFLRGRANLRDVDERLRLARWCHLHGLREQGLAEARAVLDYGRRTPRPSGWSAPSADRRWLRRRPGRRKSRRRRPGRPPR
jgi:hypothetical protein